MTKFKIGDKVRVIGSEIDFKRKEIGLEFVISSNEGEYDGEASWTDYGPGGEKKCVWRWKESELELIEQETKVTEFRAGDLVRLISSRNFYGEEFDGWGNRCGFEVGSVHELEGINPDCSKAGEFDGWNIAGGGWVRSDDIELVSRKEIDLPEPLDFSNWAEGISIDWEETLFGKHYTENAAASFKITRFEGGVNIKIPKGDYWEYDDLVEFGIHILTLAEYLETGTVDLSDDCIECENEHLRDSNERLVSANEAKRQRLAKIRELTEA